MTPDGRRRRKTLYAATQRDVLAKKRDVERAVRAGQPVSTSRPPLLREYGQDWLGATLRTRVEMKRLAPATWHFYRDLWVTHIEPDLGHIRLDALTPGVVRGWLRTKAASSSRLGRPLSPRSLQALHGVLRKALNDAVRDGILPTNPVLAVEGPAVPSRAARYLSRAEAAAIRKSVSGDPWEPLWLLLLGCGLRIGEALALRWCDVDLDGGALVVNRTVSDLQTDMDPDAPVRRRGIKESPKTPSSAARVPMPAFVAESLRSQRTSVAARRLAAVAWSDNDLVFPSAVGTFLDRSNVARHWNSACERAGVADVRLHDLRHSAATFLLAAGVDMKVVQHILRHSRLATTADLYTHVLPEVATDAAERLDAYLRDLG